MRLYLLQKRFLLLLTSHFRTLLGRSSLNWNCCEIQHLWHHEGHQCLTDVLGLEATPPGPFFFSFQTCRYILFFSPLHWRPLSLSVDFWYFWKMILLWTWREREKRERKKKKTPPRSNTELSFDQTDFSWHKTFSLSRLFHPSTAAAFDACWLNGTARCNDSAAGVIAAPPAARIQRALNTARPSGFFLPSGGRHLAPQLFFFFSSPLGKLFGVNDGCHIWFLLQLHFTA